MKLYKPVESVNVVAKTLSNSSCKKTRTPSRLFKRVSVTLPVMLPSLMSTKLLPVSTSPRFNVTLIVLSTFVSLSNISPSGTSS